MTVYYINSFMLNVNQSSCEYQFYSLWFDPESNPRSIASETDALFVTPSERLKMYSAVGCKPDLCIS